MCKNVYVKSFKKIKNFTAPFEYFRNLPTLAMPGGAEL